MSDKLKALLALEAEEQAGWPTAIPAWHPRNETPDTTGGDGGTATAEGGEGGGAPDLQAFLGTRLDEFGSKFDALGERLDRLEQPADEEEEEESAAAPVLPEFGEDDFNEKGELTLEAQTREIQRLAKRAVDEALAPDREKAAQDRRDAYTDALEEKYPDLADPEKAELYIGKAIEFARALGRPELAKEPELLEVVYLKEQAVARAGDEIPAGSEREVALERGGGAGPAAAANEGDAGDRIVNAMKGQRFRLGR